jgi:hypothetical protein
MAPRLVAHELPIRGQVSQAAAEPVEFPHDQLVTRFESLQATEKVRVLLQAFQRCPTYPLWSTGAV